MDTMLQFMKAISAALKDIFARIYHSKFWTTCWNDIVFEIVYPHMSLFVHKQPSGFKVSSRSKESKRKTKTAKLKSPAPTLWSSCRQFFFFPTCQVRVVRFYTRHPPLLLPPSFFFFLFFFFFSSSFSPALHRSGQRQTSTGALPSRAGNAGPQKPRKGTKICQKSCQKERQKRYPKKLPNDSEEMSQTLSEENQKECRNIYQRECPQKCQKEREKMCQKECRKKCHKICQKKCQKIWCQKDCEKKCQKECQKIVRKMSEDMSERMPKDMPERMPEECLKDLAECHLPKKMS